MTPSLYEPFYCDTYDSIVYGLFANWRYCPLCGSPLSEELRARLAAPKREDAHDVRRPL